MDMARIRIDDLSDKVDLNEKDLEKVSAGATAQPTQPTQKFGSLERLAKSSLSGAGSLGL